MDLLLEIAHCPVAKSCLENKHTSHPCSDIVESQDVKTWTDYQLPEPWNGDLEHASILFLSSNPSISKHKNYLKQERYPHGSWQDSEVTDFFTHRFDGIQTLWVKDGLYHLCNDCKYNQKWVRFWAATRKRASELLSKDSRDIQPGKDYAISEVVHCKSKDETGVESALRPCTKRYLRRIIELSPAKVVVALGRFAEPATRDTFSIPSNVRIHGPIQVGTQKRHFAFLPHPNARKVRSLSKCLTPEEIACLRKVLGVT